MAKKKNRIEENYKKFSKMTPEKLEEYKNGLEEELKEIQERIENKEKELEGRQASIDITADQDKKDILIAQKETADQEKADLDEMKAKKEKEIKEFENWDANKEKIDKIVDYKKKLNKSLKYNQTRTKNLKAELKDKKDEKKEIDKKLSKSEELDNNEYNELMKQKETLEKEIEKREKKIAELEKRIKTTQGSINKADMVWKNLMLGKSWDEIHLKAVRMNELGDYKMSGKQRAKVQAEAKKFEDAPTVPMPGDSKTEPINRKELEDEPVKKPDTRGIDHIVADEDKTLPKEDGGFISELDKIKAKTNSETKREPEKDEVEETKALAEYDEFAQKHPRLAKIRDFFRKFRITTDPKGRAFDPGSKGKSKALPEADSKEESKEESKQTQHDAFVEQLRQMVDEEYKRQVRSSKEQEYIEMHKPTPKEDNKEASSEEKGEDGAER